MSRRKPVLVALVGLAALPVMSAGCKDEVLPPQAVFDSRLEAASTGNCKHSGGLFSVGAFANTALDPNATSSVVKDGDSFGQGTASVSCSVKAAGDGFDVAASVALSGATGGLFRIEGKLKPNTTEDQSGVYAIFTGRLSNGNYEQKDRTCIVSFEGAQGVAAGRVWGDIECPTAEDTTAKSTCRAVAEFRFENCDQ